MTPTPRSDARTRLTRLTRSRGLVIVAVDAGDSVDAVDWAAAQASAVGADLHIVNVYQPPSALDPFALAAGIDLAVIGAAESVVHDAAERARSIARGLTVTTRIVPGSPASVILRETPPGALIVLGRHGRLRDRAIAKVLRRSRGPVAVVSLAGETELGPSTARVVVAYDGAPGSETAVDVALREARRRDLGLTVLRLDVVDEPQFIAESRAAALLVLPRTRRFRRLRGAIQAATTPVLVVPHPPG